MLSIIFAGILFAMVGVAWTIDKRAARRRESENFELGRIVERGVSKLTQHEKDMLFADVMADHHERNLSVNERKWGWYVNLWAAVFALLCLLGSYLTFMWWLA